MNFQDLHDRNRSEGKVARFLVGRTERHPFVDLSDGSSLQEAVERYSRMKFGDVGELQWWGREISRALVADLEQGGILRSVFESARDTGAHIYLTAPGVRNVISASNRLLWEVGMRTNVWLSQRGLPTMICRQIARLGSGRANYAELSEAERKGRNKSTKSLIPASDYAEFPIHVLFLDDVEVTGSTVERAKRKSLAAGALSFHSIFGMQIHPEVAAAEPGIEHQLNQFAVQGGLDEVVKQILSHPDYQPVQRMLRLLLHPRNREELPAFLAELPTTILLRLYTGAMSNDYLWINPDPETGTPLYQSSLKIFSDFLRSNGLVGPDGLVY